MSRVERAASTSAARPATASHTRWAQGFSWAALWLFACSDPADAGQDLRLDAGADTAVPPPPPSADVRLVGWETPTPLTVGSQLTPRFEGLVVWESARLVIEGDASNGVEVVSSQGEIAPPSFRVPSSLFPQLAAGEVRTLTLQLLLDDRPIDGPQGPFPFVHLAAPALPPVAGRVLAVGGWLRLAAQHVPRPDEGEAWLQFDGRLDADDPTQTQPSLSFRVAVSAPDATRMAVQGELPPLPTGVLRGTVAIHSQSVAGRQQSGAAVPVELILVPPAPTVASSLTLAPGWGFAVLQGAAPGRARDWELLGTLEQPGRTSQTALLPCDVLDDTLWCTAAPAPRGSGDGFMGWGPVTGPGILTLSLQLRDVSWPVVADPVAVSVALQGAVQYVRVVTNGGFYRALERFGLAVAAPRIEAQALARMALHLDPDRVRFVSARQQVPASPAHVTLLELGGPDPNGLGLLGYDNTPGKDVGNVRMGDRIGGSNAITQQSGAPGYGGVFVESFLFWSESPPAPLVRPPASPSPDPLFDAVFGSFLATPLTADEWSDATAPRHEAAQRAVTALAHLIAETAAHEVGHALGLANPSVLDGAFHRAGDVPGCLMEAGEARPLQERMGLDGARAAGLCGDEAEYLRRILPGGTF